MKQVRIGVIGLGRMGQHHCRIYSNLKDAQLVGVYDIDKELTESTSAKYESIAFQNLDDLLDEVDAVTIATPTPTHSDLAMRCIDHKIHVLIEKPVTEKVGDAEYIDQALAKEDIIFQVGHIERFNPTFIELKKVLQQVNAIAINFRRLSPYRVSNTDVDVVLDLMVHDLDLSNDMTGKLPDKVSAFGLMPFSSTLDHVAAQLYYEDSPLITLTASRVTEQKIRSVDVTAAEAYIEADFMNKSICIYSGSRGEFLGKNQNGVSYRQESIIERILVPNIEPLSSEIQSFLDCISQNRPPRVTMSDGLAALRLANKISAMAYEQNYLQFPCVPLEVSREEIS